MEEVIKNLQRWLQDDYDEASKNKVKWLAEIQNFDVLNDAFCQELQLGFRGIKAKKGVGINRINQYTIGKVVHALAQFLQFQYPKQEITVVIGYDNREKSNKYAHFACNVLTAQHIRVHFADLPRPSPLLSHHVLTLKAHAGVSINGGSLPNSYNGIILYDYQGIPMASKRLETIQHYLDEIRSIRELPKVENLRLIDFIAEREEDKYIDSLKDFVSLFAKGIHEKVTVIYDPLHGTGALLGSAFSSINPFAHVIPVEAHFEMNQKFEGLSAPDPLDPQNFAKSIEVARENQADMILTTDADGGRTGLAIKDHVNDFHPLQGYQIAALLLDFIIRIKMPFQLGSASFLLLKDPASSSLINKIAEANSLSCIEVDNFDGSQLKDHPSENILFALDKEYGFYFPDHVHDRDAFATASLLTAMCAYWKFMGKRLADRLLEIYAMYGYFHEERFSLHFPTGDGKDQMLDELNQIQHRFFPAFGKYATEQFYVHQNKQVFSIHEMDSHWITEKEDVRYSIKLENNLLIHINANFNNATLEFLLEGFAGIKNIREYPAKRETLKHMLTKIKTSF